VNRSWLCFIIRLRIRHVPLCSIGNSSNSIILEIARSFPLPKSSKTLVPSWCPFQYRQALESKRNTKGIPPGPPPWQEIPLPGCGCLSEGAVNNARRKMSQVRLSLLRLGTNWARAAQTCPKCGTRLEIDLGKGERPIRRTPQDPKPC
jgi:hypothetical protein